MTALIDAVAAAGADLQAAAARIGCRIAFDAAIALSRDARLAPPGSASPNGTCRMIAARDGWIAVNLARADDRAAVPAWTGCELEADPWAAIAAFARAHDAAGLLAGAIGLHLPVAIVGERCAEPVALPSGQRKPGGRPAAVDLTALWAGPYCGALLAEAGVTVTRIEDPRRPDRMGDLSPKLAARLDRAKARLSLRIDDPALVDRIAAADILVTAGRPHALARQGLSRQALFARNPGLIWVAITAHGWHGDAAMRVGFGDDCAAAGGLVGWDDGAPRFLGDALGDPVTGIAAATAALTALADSRAGLIDISLAASAARLAARL